MTADSKGRSVRVGGVDLHFASIEALEAHAEMEKRALAALEAGALTRNPRDPKAWAEVEQHAATLRDLLFGLDDWIKAEEAELDAEIAAVRRLIADLGGELL